MKSFITIRLAEISDLPSIVEIYNQAIRAGRTTGDMEEFTVEQRMDWFNHFDSDEYPIYVAEHNSKIVGYATLSPYRPGRRAMSKIAEISFFVDYSYHKMGMGQTLLEHVTSDCTRLGKEVLLAILLAVNKPSIKLLKRFGFVEWGHLPNVIDFDGERCGHLIYGVHLKDL